MFENAVGPHDVLNEFAAFEKLNRAIHAAHSFIRQISCARDITRLLAVWERARKVFISIAID